MNFTFLTLWLIYWTTRINIRQKPQKLELLPEMNLDFTSLRFLTREWEWNNITEPKFSKNSSEKKPGIFTM